MNEAQPRNSDSFVVAALQQLGRAGGSVVAFDVFADSVQCLAVGKPAQVQIRHFDVGAVPPLLERQGAFLECSQELFVWGAVRHHPPCTGGKSDTSSPSWST